MNTLLQVFDPANIGAFFTQFQADMQQPTFWLAVGKIIWINVLLSGDNALVIAMAVAWPLVLLDNSLFVGGRGAEICLAGRRL